MKDVGAMHQTSKPGRDPATKVSYTPGCIGRNLGSSTAPANTGNKNREVNTPQTEPRDVGQQGLGTCSAGQVTEHTTVIAKPRVKT